MPPGAPPSRGFAGLSRLACGAHAVTVTPALLRAAICSPLVQGAVAAFEEDFALYHSEGLLNALQA